MRATLPLRRTALVATWCAALALTGCGDDDGTAATGGEAAVTTTTGTGATTTTSAPPSTTTTAPTTTAPADPTTTVPAFPAAREDLEHGGATWAVVLAAAEDTTHPDLAAAEAAAADAGYRTGPTDCDEGAADALGHGGDGHWYTVSVYFPSRDDAEQAAAAFAAHGHAGAAVAEVRTFCLD